MIQTEIEALGEKIYESSAFITRLTDATANVIVEAGKYDRPTTCRAAHERAYSIGRLARI
jgi:hypothetical protein